MLLATDVCSVAPFAVDAPILDSIVGAGATVASSAFSCSSFGRFGFVSDAASQAANTVPGAVAPVGAATVPETVRALNEFGIRVLGLGPGAGPTASTTPSDQPSTFLSALVRLTGAVAAMGEPLVFDIGNDSADIRAAIVSAVETCVKTPIDTALLPDPKIPGLTVTATPLVFENVFPGEEACFSVGLEGGESFKGGGLGLTFVDIASNGGLGMVPVRLRCRHCFGLSRQTLLCEVDPTGVTSFEWTFVVRNRTSEDIVHLFLLDLPAGVTVDSRHVTFSPPILPNAAREVTVRIAGATPETVLNFRMTLHDAAIDECCVKRVKLELPCFF